MELDQLTALPTGMPQLLPLLRGRGQESEAAPAEESDLSLEDVNDIKFGYCTEFCVIHLVESFTEGDLEKFRDKLLMIGE